jgi:transcriptional regulator with XRE-family HTH domain
METDNYTKKLSQNLKSIRQSKGLTTVDLARILGVSQAKISYIEHCKGILSARDLAVLSRRLDVPISEFFRGITEPEDATGVNELVIHLARYGAVLLAKPAGVTLHAVPFEDVFARALGFIEDDRLHKGFCAAWIAQAARREINIDRIFALIGNNPFLTDKAAEQAQICLQIVDWLNEKKKQVHARSKQQISKIEFIANRLLANPHSKAVLTNDELSDLGQFVEECLSAKR